MLIDSTILKNILAAKYAKSELDAHETGDRASGAESNAYDTVIGIVNELEQAPADNWISVNDRLPPLEKAPFSAPVLTLCNTGKMQCFGFDYEFNNWTSPVYYPRITHWQPLPNPPKTEL